MGGLVVQLLEVISEEIPAHGRSGHPVVVPEHAVAHLVAHDARAVSIRHTRSGRRYRDTPRSKESYALYAK